MLIGVEENSATERSVAVALRPPTDVDAKVEFMEQATRKHLGPWTLRDTVDRVPRRSGVMLAV